MPNPGRVSPPGVEEEPLRLSPDGSLVSLEAGNWFVCFVPPIDEPWWTRLLVATITTEQAVKFLRWGRTVTFCWFAKRSLATSIQLRGMMTCAALAAHMLGRTYFV